MHATTLAKSFSIWIFTPLTIHTKIFKSLAYDQKLSLTQQIEFI
jgi:hypothetical protein